MAGTRRARHSIIILFYVVVIVAKSCGFQAPPCVVPNGCKAWRCCYLELGQPRLRSAMKIRQRPGLRDEFGRSFRTGKGYLLSSPGDGSGGGKRIAEVNMIHFRCFCPQLLLVRMYYVLSVVLESKLPFANVAGTTILQLNHAQCCCTKACVSLVITLSRFGINLL